MTIRVVIVSLKFQQNSGPSRIVLRRDLQHADQEKNLLQRHSCHEALERRFHLSRYVVEAFKLRAAAENG